MSPTRISANSKTSAVHQLSQHMFHTTPTIELLPSFCIHALHMSYPYLVIASGDRIGVWNVDVNFLFRNSADKSNEEACNNTSPDRDVYLESFRATTLPPSNSAHRRATSTYITQYGHSLAIACWDGSTFVYVANSTANHDGGHGNLVHRGLRWLTTALATSYSG